MSNFYVFFNGIKDSDLGIYSVKRPNIPIPSKNIVEEDVPGRDGKLITDLGTYNNIEISVQYNYASREEFCTIGRKIKSWVHEIEDNKLSFSDDPEWFYKVEYCRLEVIERIFKVKGTFELTFVCKPYQYSFSGLKTLEFTSNNITIKNIYAKTSPIYAITGSGEPTFLFNNKEVKINLGSNIKLIIDVDKRVCYKSDRTYRNIDITGYYEDMKLIKGANTISWSGGNVTKVEVIPNWRCL